MPQTIDQPIRSFSHCLIPGGGGDVSDTATYYHDNIFTNENGTPKLSSINKFLNNEFYVQILSNEKLNAEVRILRVIPLTPTQSNIPLHQEFYYQRPSSSAELSPHYRQF